MVIEVSIEREAHAWASYMIAESIDFSYARGTCHVFTTDDPDDDEFENAKEEVAAELELSGPEALSAEVVAS